MPASYSYIDVATLDAVRGRFAGGDALAILSIDLEQVIWANGPGAEMLGYPDIGSVIGASSQLGLAARRQVAATSGFPNIGNDRPIAVRLTAGMTSRAAALLASSLTLPDGEKAILLAMPVAHAASRSHKELSERAISGFTEPGQFTALLGVDGSIEAASRDFATLGIGAEALGKLVADLGGEHDRIVRRAIPTATSKLPAGLARLSDDPARYLLVVVDDRAERSDETPADADATEPHSDAGKPTEAVETAEEKGAPANPARPMVAASINEHDEEGPTDDPTVKAASEQPRAPEQPAASHHDEWYFSADGKAIERAPVRFVWRTDAEGRFSVISREFASAVGERAADVVGRAFSDVATRFGLDPDGEIAGLLARRDTWSGRSVLWPVAGTDLKVPVDLAALPAYGRDRIFEGFRGFGVARPGDAIVDAAAIGLTLTDAALPEAPEAVEPEEETVPVGLSNPSGDKASDPFKGEVPVLSIAPKPDRRFSDKVIRLAEHRQPANEKGLSSVERNAFREIGERLRQEDRSGNTVSETAAETPRDSQPKAEHPTAGNERERPANDERPEVDLIALEESDAIDEEDLARLDGTDVTSAEDEVADVALSRATEAPTGEAEIPANDVAPGEADIQPEAVDAALTSPEAAVSEDTDDQGPAAPANEVPESESAPALSGEVQPEKQEAEPASPRARSLLDFVGHEAEDAETAAYSEANEARLQGDSTEGDAPAVAEALSYADGEAATGEADASDRDEPDDEDTLADEEAPRAAPDTSILDKLPVPVLIHAGDTLHHANGEFLALTGYASVQALADAGGLGALFAASDDDHVDGPDRQMRLTTRDGREVPVSAHLRSVPWGSGKALMLVVQPSAEEAQRAAEPLPLQPAVADLQARVAEMRTIIDTATDGVVLIAPDTTIRSISRPAEALFGFDSDDVAGKPFASLFAIESQRAAHDYLVGLSEHGVASVLNDGREVIGREAEGRFIPLFMTIGRLPGDSGFCAVVRDITQWKRAEEELTQARAVAERASSQKSEFLARVSHEIRTPLNAIIGFSELMIDEKFGPVANDRYRDYLRDINRSGNHVLDLVNDLLDISKIEAGQQEMSYEAVSLNDTLAETVAMMQPQANRERVIIRSSFASKLPDVVADLRSVRQIALNILSNAVRYTQAGGQVIVSTAYETSGDIVMRVRDTGIGMSQAEIEQALKPFKQINALKRGRHDGTGLGLPLTKAMVEANRAKFSILSTPGEGTLVEITFPSTRVLAQ